MECTSERKIKFDHWVGRACRQEVVSIKALASDASMRHYYRVRTTSASYVAMDAPPPQENCRPFIVIAAALRNLGLRAPEVPAADLENGFLLLTDFGDTTFLKHLSQNKSTEQADDLYTGALRALSVMQSCHTVENYELAPFDREWMQREWSWHKEWFLQKWLGVSFQSIEQALDDCYEVLVQSAENQPQAFMHRDYHSANLMVLADHEVGILDFQDAFIGPQTYDLVSLLRDCYIDWPPEKVREWAMLYAGMLREQGQLQQVNDQVFMRWFDMMGIQRHIKALLTFARKFVRDQQPEYLQHVPRTLKYITTVSQQYLELQALTDFYAGIVLKKQDELCAQ